MEREQPRITIGFIGAGPRTVGLVERLIANAPLLAADTHFDLLLIDPYPAGPGRIWRFAQSPSLMMNSLAEDVTMFADETSTLEGPLVTGFSLDQWLARVQSGELVLPTSDARLAREAAAIGPKGFATRRLFSCYLRWCYEHVTSLAPEHIRIREIAGAVEKVETDRASELIHYVDDRGNRHTLGVDLVVYALGHTDTDISTTERDMAARAHAGNLGYWPANYAYEGDYAAIPADEPVLLRGLGLSFIDIVVMLTLDRGGAVEQDPTAPIGTRARYRRSGREPRIFAGSGRGVPYRSKITSSVHGENPGMRTTFLTTDALMAIEQERGELDFGRDVWPLIVKELAFWHYREIFTGHPDRVRVPWSEAEAIFHRHAAGAEAFDREIRALVAADDVFDIRHLDQPLANVHKNSLHDFQHVLTEHITHDLFVRESEEHSETQSVFLATLACYGVVAESLATLNWNAESRVHAVPRTWHTFFSYLDSGPPAQRLELLLALMREGVLTFVGGGLEIAIRNDAFIATSPNHPEAVSSRYLIEAYHPDQSVIASANPALRDIVDQCEGREYVLQTDTGDVSTQRLHVDSERARLIRPDGSTHPRRFAVGDFTSGPPSAAFSRPRTNARIFRENDTIARDLLSVASELAEERPASSLRV